MSTQISVTLTCSMCPCWQVAYWISWKVTWVRCSASPSWWTWHHRSAQIICCCISLIHSELNHRCFPSVWTITKLLSLLRLLRGWLMWRGWTMCTETSELLTSWWEITWFAKWLISVWLASLRIMNILPGKVRPQEGVVGSWLHRVAAS